MDTKVMKNKVMETQVSTPRPRLLSLDFFRGVTVAAMILVNNPGSWKHIYAPLEHSVWNGCTPTDLIFPFFLFIVGVSIVYAMESKKENPQEHPKLLWSIFRRSLMIIGLGIALSLLSDFQFSHTRIPGVLPRIALVFGISAFIYVKTSTKTQVYSLLALLTGYYLLMTFVPVPGIGMANLAPETNLGAWLDRLVFTENHLWRGAKGWDPEGLLGTIPAVATALTGILTGTFLKKESATQKNGLGRLMGYGVGLIVMGLIWNLTFPINKSLWTSSFVLFTSGFAIVILTISYWIIDVKGYSRGISPFVAFGRNPITAYTLAGIIPTIFSWITLNVHGHRLNVWSYVNQYVLEPACTPKNASLISAILIVLLLFAPIWWMYKKKIIIKI